MPKKKVLSKDAQELVNKKLSEISVQAEEAGKLKVEDFFPKCGKCSSLMERVHPAIEMPTPRGILELHECTSCGEREYL